MFHNVTGNKQVLVRSGFSDYDSYGSGNFAMAATGNLDAPNFIPNGSVRVFNTSKHAPGLSLSSRWKEIGEQNNGPESVPSTLFDGFCLPRS